MRKLLLLCTVAAGCGGNGAEPDATLPTSADAALIVADAAPATPDAASLPSPDAAVPTPDARTPDARTPDAAPPITDLYVDCAKGNDGGGGTSLAPYKSITHALAQAGAGMTVHVAPCTYDETNGEVFPMLIPPSVTLVGDETSKGEGTKATRIVGRVATFLRGTVEPGAGSTLAGFAVRNSATPDVGSDSMIVTVTTSSVTMRNNSLRDSPGTGIYVNGGSDLVIAGNRITGNRRGLSFRLGGAGSRAEHNEIRNNMYGIEFDAEGGDLGGGPNGSAGGNMLSCNMLNDLWTNETITIYAKNNAWDHAPPTKDMVAEDGRDLRYGPATILTTGATVASSPCP